MTLPHVDRSNVLVEGGDLNADFVHADGLRGERNVQVPQALIVLEDVQQRREVDAAATQVENFEPVEHREAEEVAVGGDVHVVPNHQFRQIPARDADRLQAGRVEELRGVQAKIRERLPVRPDEADEVAGLDGVEVPAGAQVQLPDQPTALAQRLNQPRVDEVPIKLQVDLHVQQRVGGEVTERLTDLRALEQRLEVEEREDVEENFVRDVADDFLSFTRPRFHNRILRAKPDVLDELVQVVLQEILDRFRRRPLRNELHRLQLLLDDSLPLRQRLLHRQVELDAIEENPIDARVVINQAVVELDAENAARKSMSREALKAFNVTHRMGKSIWLIGGRNSRAFFSTGAGSDCQRTFQHFEMAQ